MIIPDDAVEFAGKIFAGEYDVKKYMKQQPSILDIGANIGSFAVWASYRWPGSAIKCYEPIRSNYAYLIENTKSNENIKCYNAAIGAEEERRNMYYGLQNCGQCSLYRTEEQLSYGEEVQAISARGLEYADIVKIDTEGAEVEIIENLTFKPDLFLLEYHSIKDKNRIIDFLSNYTVLEFAMMNRRSGSLKLVRDDLVG